MAASFVAASGHRWQPTARAAGAHSTIVDSTAVVATSPAVTTGPPLGPPGPSVAEPVSPPHKVARHSGIEWDLADAIGILAQPPSLGGSQVDVKWARLGWWRNLVSAALPPDLAGEFRARVVWHTVDDWHPVTRDNYLGVLH